MSKRWRIEVSALGSEEATAQATVEAANWMTALKAGRTALGELGGLPPGANLRHEAGGAVTIHDARERKTYRLFPSDGDAPAAPSAAAAHAQAASAAVPAKKPRPKTIAYIPGEDLAAIHQAAQAAVQAGPSVEAAAVTVARGAPAAASEANAAPLTRKKKAMTMAYMPGQDFPTDLRHATVGGLATADTIQEARLPSSPPASVSPPAPAEPALTEIDVEILLSRDAEPNEENPLRYRERAYVVPSTLTPAEAEAVARGELATLQAELEPFPTGKFVSIAVFDHAWDDHPARPPVVTLEWKDWHGEPVVAFPLADDGGRPLSVAPPPMDPSERLSAAFEACQDLFFLERPIDALEFAVRLLAELLPTDFTIASIYDIDHDELRAASVLGADGVAGRAVRAGTGLLGVAAQDMAVSLRVHDLRADARFVAAAEGIPSMKGGAALYKAIVNQGRLFGMLQLFRRGDPRFTRDDAELVRYIGEQVGEFMGQLKTVQARAQRR